LDHPTPAHLPILIARESLAAATGNFRMLEYRDAVSYALYRERSTDQPGRTGNAVSPPLAAKLVLFYNKAWTLLAGNP